MNSNFCPKDEQLLAYASKEMSEDKYAEMEVHLASCLKCRGFLAQLSEVPTFDFSSASNATQNTRSNGFVHRFRLLRPHAKGGLGEVFLAEDTELNRRVAVKRIQQWHADNATSRERFAREAHICGQLEHPAVVPVYGVGCDKDGRPYYAMRFIEGKSLMAAIRQARRKESSYLDSLSFRRFVSSLVVVCEATAYAHNKGIIHRDIKPDNIMLGNYGETLLVDWGLAKELKEKNVMPGLPMRDGVSTQVGKAVGTPGYMSPEQAAGDVAGTGKHSDIYSLGATLLTILDGSATPPKTRAAIWPIFRKCKHPALQAIARKAMAPVPADRYCNAQALVADLENWLADKPVSAFAEPIQTRFRRWSKERLRAPANIGLLLLLAGFFMVYGSVVQTIQNKLEKVEQATADQSRHSEELRLQESQIKRSALELDKFEAELKEYFPTQYSEWQRKRDKEFAEEADALAEEADAKARQLRQLLSIP